VSSSLTIRSIVAMRIDSATYSRRNSGSRRLLDG
jgi:hypothetical protein